MDWVFLFHRGVNLQQNPSGGPFLAALHRKWWPILLVQCARALFPSVSPLVTKEQAWPAGGRHSDENLENRWHAGLPLNGQWAEFSEQQPLSRAMGLVIRFCLYFGVTLTAKKNMVNLKTVGSAFKHFRALLIFYRCVPVLINHVCLIMSIKMWVAPNGGSGLGKVF